MRATYGVLKFELRKTARTQYESKRFCVCHGPAVTATDGWAPVLVKRPTGHARQLVLDRLVDARD